jgi:hypothetical protein
MLTLYFRSRCGFYADREARHRGGREAFDEHFSMRTALGQWSELLAELGYRSS